VCSVLSEGPGNQNSYLLYFLGPKVETHIEATMRSECRVQGQVDAIFGRKRDSKGSGSFRENGFSGLSRTRKRVAAALQQYCTHFACQPLTASLKGPEGCLPQEKRKKGSRLSLAKGQHTKSEINRF
jgi:hypothetical protein